MPKVSAAERIDGQFEEIKTKFFEKIDELTPLITDKVLQSVADKQSIADQKYDTLIAANNALREVNMRLMDRISALERCLRKDTPDEPPSPEDYSPPSYVYSKPTSPLPGKKAYNVLILLDSIYRHVGGECAVKPAPPNVTPAAGKRARRPPQPPVIQDIELLEGIKGLKVVVPGAQCPRLLSEAARVSQHCTFDHVIVHVGTNYSFSELSSFEIAEEIAEFLSEIQCLFQCKVSFSEILPRILDESYDQLITFSNIIFPNKLIARTCEYLKIACMCYDRFHWN